MRVVLGTNFNTKTGKVIGSGDPDPISHNAERAVIDGDGGDWNLVQNNGVYSSSFSLTGCVELTMLQVPAQHRSCHMCTFTSFHGQDRFQI